MAFSRNDLGRTLAKLTPTRAGALRRLRSGDELVAHGAGVFTIGGELYGKRTVEPLIASEFVSLPLDLFATATEGGRISDSGLTALDWHDKGAGA